MHGRRLINHANKFRSEIIPDIGSLSMSTSSMQVTPLLGGFPHHQFSGVEGGEHKRERLMVSAVELTVVDMHVLH